MCKSVCVQESGREWERVWGWMCKCVRVHKYVCGMRGGEEECVHIHICDSGGDLFKCMWVCLFTIVCVCV